MDNWKEIVNIAIAKPNVGDATFVSDGDWSAIIHQR